MHLQNLEIKCISLQEDAMKYILTLTHLNMYGQPRNPRVLLFKISCEPSQELLMACRAFRSGPMHTKLIGSAA